MASFPLLALAAPGKGSRDPVEVLAALEGRAPLGGVTKRWIAPKAGEYWLAAGIEFTSFELIHTKALLVAEFGEELTFALLGLSTMRLPREADRKHCYAYVEMMLRVVLAPARGSVEATAILGPNSYVIAPDCHLTGGYAFSLWFGHNPNAGQFVVTMGGYHPAFKVPDHFPKLPRLGFNWAVSTTVAIKGEAYFALTSSCIMAGGGLEILFQDGDLRAWFTARIDVLVSWNPFFFQAQIAISVGVSYRLDLGFCHKTISASIGADLSLWGPPTGGVVRIDLVVVSFSVRFGSDGAGAATQPLNWDGFKALLPAEKTICQIAIVDGLYKTQEAPANAADNAPIWIVRAARIRFETRSAIPASRLSFGTTTVRASTSAPNGIDIRAMDRAGVSSTHTLQIFEGDSSTPVSATAAGWEFKSLKQSVPAALWGKPPEPFSQVPAQPSADVVAGALCGFSVTAPEPRLGATRGAVTPVALEQVYLQPSGRAPLSAAETPSRSYLPVADPQSVPRISKTMDTSVKASRDEVFALLRGASVFDGTNGDLSLLAKAARRLYSASPMRQG